MLHYLRSHKVSYLRGTPLPGSSSISHSELKRGMYLGDVGWAHGRSPAMRTLRVEVLATENAEALPARETCPLERKEKGEDPRKDGGAEAHEVPGGLSWKSGSFHVLLAEGEGEGWEVLWPWLMQFLGPETLSKSTLAHLSAIGESFRIAESRSRSLLALCVFPRSTLHRY